MESVEGHGGGVTDGQPGYAASVVSMYLHVLHG
jgi:hypothetical protein